MPIDDDEFGLPAHIHDIVKHPEHGGECRKCGILGSWTWIKSQPCPGKPKTTETFKPSPGATAMTEGARTESSQKVLGEMLDKALEVGDNQQAFAIVDQMETLEAEQLLADQELMLQLLEEELALENAIGEFEKLQLEDEKALEEAVELSMQPLSKEDGLDKAKTNPTRPPATPLQQPVIKTPVVCYLATSIWMS